MVYLEDFDEFQIAAQTLFTKKPLRTRFLLKYRHKDGKAVLKVTDDKVCLKYRTDQISELKRITSFSQAYARWMVSSNFDTLDQPDAELEDAKEAAKPKAKGKQRKK
eukprot:TRINITY_DN32101_c0_g1_i1.p2 TRINITY_DN32101_c0_g1~~TRINITY_DN32101_c0_g1_i1.p2  ORF type:complete len:107 (-),score=31.53 TRINITY_DN32101_c0_g1_i1:59-379(-)